MTGPGRRRATQTGRRLRPVDADRINSNPIPAPGGRASIDQLYRSAAHVGPAGGPEHRAAFVRLVRAVWPPPRPGRT